MEQTKHLIRRARRAVGMLQWARAWPLVWVEKETRGPHSSFAGVPNGSQNHR